MAKRRTVSRRRDLATWLMMLLPGFMFVGLLAPAAVNVKPKAQDEIGPISFRNFTPRRPIQFSLATGHGASSEMRIEPAFSGARFVADPAARAPEVDVAGAANNSGNEILLADDNVETYVAETLFETPIDDPEPQLAVDLNPLWDPSLFDVIPELIDRNAYELWDDFHGTGVRFSKALPQSGVIPEPGTGGLVAIGLAALAIRRRRRG